MDRKRQQSRRIDPGFTPDDLSALDETQEIDINLGQPLGDLGVLALDLREMGARVKKLGAMNGMQQMAHAPDLISEALGQMAYALELIELNGHG